MENESLVDMVRKGLLEDIIEFSYDYMFVQIFIFSDLIVFLFDYRVFLEKDLIEMFILVLLEQVGESLEVQVKVQVKIYVRIQVRDQVKIIDKSFCLSVGENLGVLVMIFF